MGRAARAPRRPRTGAARRPARRHRSLARPRPRRRVHLVPARRRRAGGPPAGTATPGAGEGGSAAPAGLVNLNTASQAELEKLSGVGPSLAQAIIAERERRGGFRSVNELRDVRGIGEKRFADL